MGLTDSQEEALRVLKIGKNVFLTGPGGCGKSYVINEYDKWCKQNGVRCEITATTGVSALLIGGTTIHSWAGVGLGDGTKEDILARVQKNRFAIRHWKETDCLVIDEISMMPPGLFEALDYVGREIRQRKQTVFGGMQIVLSGDFAQLPPVKCPHYIFESRLWPLCVQSTITFTELIRQQDPQWRESLLEVRKAQPSQLTMDLLKSRINVDVSIDGIKPTQLRTLRADVDDINEKELAKLKESGAQFQIFTATYKVKSTGFNKPSLATIDSFVTKLRQSTQAPDVLEIAVGSQVMLLYNRDVKSGFVNGSRGVVVGFTPQVNDNDKVLPIVNFVGNSNVIVQPQSWSMKIDDTNKMCKYQIPLMLADACTIHKAQGSSLDLAQIDLGVKTFDYGQSYTALSRVRTLEGLSLIDIDFSKMRTDPKVMAFYQWN